MSALTITYVDAVSATLAGALLARDSAALLTFANLPAGTGRSVRLTDLSGRMALTASAEVVTNAATINTNTRVVEVLMVDVETSLQVRLEVSDLSGKVLSVPVRLHQSALPNLDAPGRSTNQYLTTEQVQALIDEQSGAGKPSEAKTVPADADGLTLWDSVAEFAGKFLSWANLKAALALVFAPLSHKDQHATAGDDALSPSDIGAEEAGAVGDHNGDTDAHPFTAANKFRYGGTEGATTEADITAAGRAILDDATAAAQLETLGAQAAASGTALPTGASIVTGQVFRLTAADNTAKAAPGLYVHDGTGWACQLPFAAYAWGNTGATPTLALITGCPYILTQDQAISSCAITMSRPGVVVIAKTGLFTFAVPTMAGRTVLPRTSAGWTSAGAASVEIALFDDGTRLWISAVEGVA